MITSYSCISVRLSILSQYSFKKLFHLVDYFVINVSSPNTPGLRKLQNKNLLFDLLNKLQRENFTESYLKLDVVTDFPLQIILRYFKFR